MIESLVLKIRRAETPFYAGVKKAIINLQRTRMPIPPGAQALLRLSYHGQRGAVELARRVWSFAYREPVFRSLCDRVGEELYLEQTPKVSGNPRITIGDRVTISGDLAVETGAIFPRPLLAIGNDAFLGHRLTIALAKSITIEDGVMIAGNCFIADFDGHPSNYADRIAGQRTPPHEVKPVRIGRHAWIGRNCVILKGVTIGEGAVIGAGSVVRSEIPSFAIAYGNPARVVRTRSESPVV